MGGLGGQSGWFLLGALCAVGLAHAVAPPRAKDAGFGLEIAGLLADRPAATGIWAGTVLHVLGPAPRVTVVGHGALAAGTRDPCFAAPLAYGALLLRSAGELPGAAVLLREGARTCPEDPWFPMVLALQLREEGDPAALGWMTQAAALPGASDVLRAVAGRWAEGT